MQDKWLTFDCYGTLVDWRTGMAGAIEPLVGPAATARVLQAYHRAELVVEGVEKWRPYREVLTVGLRAAAQAEGVALADTDADAFVRDWTRMPVFPDVAESLSTLQRDGWRLAIITNCDDDLIAGTQKMLPVTFDAVVTAEGVGSYRPDLGHFRSFESRFGASSANWIHVGTSWVHDVLPATRMGLRSVWVDRDRSGHPAELATVRAEDLTTLPDDIERALSVGPAVRP